MFLVNVQHENRKLKVYAEQILFAANKEQFKIYGKYGELVFESNRPLLRNKGLKHVQPIWKMVSGTLAYQTMIYNIALALMNYLEPVIKNPNKK